MIGVIDEVIRIYIEQPACCRIGIGKGVNACQSDCSGGANYAENQLFALDSTTISLSIKLFTWAFGKYSGGAVKVHTPLDLRGSIPTFNHISHGKYHDSNVLDFMPLEKDAIYVMDKAYIDFAALYDMEQVGAFFVTRAKDIYAPALNRS